MTNYRDIPRLLNSRIPFEGNTMSAVLDAQGRYLVFSYNTEIARVENGRVHHNPKKYSKTTSRQQRLCLNHL